MTFSETEREIIRATARSCRDGHMKNDCFWIRGDDADRHATAYDEMGFLKIKKLIDKRMNVQVSGCLAGHLYAQCAIRGLTYREAQSIEVRLGNHLWESNLHWFSDSTKSKALYTELMEIASEKVAA